MSSDCPTYRLTFNNAAGSKLPEGTRGFLIDIFEDYLVFEPVRESTGFRVAPVSFRKRGGAEVTIGGKRGPELIKLLTKNADPSTPFFKVIPIAAGRFTIQHFPKNTPPLKSLPSMRVWFPKVAASGLAEDALSSFSVVERMMYFNTMILNARKTLDEAERVRKIGRPSSEVIAAKDTMERFVALAEKAIPSFNNTAQREGISDALAILQRISTAPTTIKREVRPEPHDSGTIVPINTPFHEPHETSGQFIAAPELILSKSAALDTTVQPTDEHDIPEAGFHEEPLHEGVLDGAAVGLTELTYLREGDENTDEITPPARRSTHKTHWERSRHQKPHQRRA